MPELHVHQNIWDDDEPFAFDRNVVRPKIELNRERIPPAQVEHLRDHKADVVEYLGQDEPQGACFGVEIELGWTHEDRRENFFDALDALGLQKKLVSKHDGTVQADYNSEIVTGAFDRKEIREIVGQVGGLIEKFANEGLRTNFCGVHVHLSEAPLERDQVWRAHCSLLNSDSRHSFWNRLMKKNPDFYEKLATWNEFLTAVSLRGPNVKSLRTGLNNIMEFMEHREKHDRAFQRGRMTPTMEYRHMRTARSKRVTLSYIDFAESHMAFCKEAPEEYFDPSPVPEDWERVGWPPRPVAPRLIRGAREVFEVNPKTKEYEAKRVFRYVNRETGALYETNQVQKIREGDEMYYYPAQNILDELGQVVPPHSQHGGARGWRNFEFPLQAYIKYVLDRADLYPSLAARLQLNRFAQYVEAHPKVFAFDQTIPHLEFQQGCKVSSENREGYYVVTSIVDPENPPDMLSIRPEGRGKQDSEFVQYLIHECPGALEKGGES